MAKLFWLCVLLLSIAVLASAEDCRTRIRKEYRDTTDEEWNLFREALLLMQTTPSRSNAALTEWDAFTVLHGSVAGYIHGTNVFLPWHRAFVLAFEKKLRSLDPKFENVTIPYWDYSADWFHPVDSPIFDPNSRYKLSVKVDPGDYSGDCNYRRNDPEPHCLIRYYYEDLFSKFPSSEVTAMVITESSSYYWIKRRIENGPHGLLHVSIGGDGDLATMSSPNDPLFWMIHTSLDRIWALWQKLDSNRLQEYPTAMNKPLPGFSSEVTIESVMDISKLCYDYADYSNDTILTYSALVARRSSGAEDPVVGTLSSVIDCLPKPVPKSWIEMNNLNEDEVHEDEDHIHKLITRTQASKLCLSGNAISQNGATPESADSQTQTSSRVTVLTGDETVPGWAVGLLVLGAVVLVTLFGFLVVVMQRR